MSKPNAAPDHGPKYHIDIEGALHPWHSDTITTEDILRLGGWDSTQGVIVVDKDNNERTLQPGEVVELKPGMGFAKKVKFKRGVR
jgi:Multiubiquitin